MSTALALDAWTTIVLDRATVIAQHLRDDPHIAAAIAQRVAALAPRGAALGSLGTPARLKQVHYLDILSRKLLRALDDLPELDFHGSARERMVACNPTRQTLSAARRGNAVEDSVVIAAVEESDQLMLRATLGELPKLPRGRLDLAAERRFGVPRDAMLRPLLWPDPPLVPQGSSSAMYEVRHGYLLDEAEHVPIVYRRSSDKRLQWQPAAQVLSHRDARALTAWSAAALDLRLAHSSSWDHVLDAARIRGCGDHGRVVFDAERFERWRLSHNG